ncbi:hypothetical protein ACO1O0_003588 [Amphichorda felina]
MELHLELGDAPIRHQDCCLSLSSKLLDTLTRIFTNRSPAALSSSSPLSILSIGSGSGLLEATLLAHSSPGLITVEGVEVQQPESQAPVNRYLPEQFYHTVRGTREVSPRLGDDDVSGLMFVYPRQPDLVSRYVKAVEEMYPNVTSVVWLGPVADWDDFWPCFEGSTFAIETRSGPESGLDDYEMMAVMHR